MIVPSPGSMVIELIAGLAPSPTAGGGSGVAPAVVGASVAAGGASVSVAVVAGSSSGFAEPQPARISAASTAAALRRTAEPRVPSGHLDRAEQVCEVLRL